MRLFLCLVALVAATSLFAKDPPTISWKKIDLDSKFRSEGVAVADVNRDGKLDVLVGEFWYEAPDWKRHEMQKPGDYGNGLGNYSKVFACWEDDLNKDGYPDLIVIDFPGEPCYWLENPKGKGTTEDGKPTHWKRHYIWHSACNETPIYVDLFNTGQRVLVMGFQPIERLVGDGKQVQTTQTRGRMAYFVPNAKDPTAMWQMKPISEPSVAGQMKDGKEVPGTRKEIPGTQKYSHGLGVGDVNGDGRLDVLTSGATTGGVGGWWEQPEKADGKTPWNFHPAQVPDACADIHTMDVDGDGKADILTTSAHKFGIWWHKQRSADKDGHPTFEKQVLFKELVSETHAAHLVDIDGNGQKDLVTGKRWWSHGRSEPGSDVSPHIYWLRAEKGSDGIVRFTPQVIDSDSGIGTQFVVQDINGDKLLDVVSSNKKGVRIILQERK
jgi:hypothetical protein